MYACYGGDKEIVQILVDKGCDIHKQSAVS